MKKTPQLFDNVNQHLTQKIFKDIYHLIRRNPIKILAKLSMILFSPINFSMDIVVKVVVNGPQSSFKKHKNRRMNRLTKFCNQSLRIIFSPSPTKLKIANKTSILNQSKNSKIHSLRQLVMK